MEREEIKEAGKLHFHYDREARLKNLSNALPEQTGTKGLFRRNRSLFITLLDVLVLIILFVIVTLLFRTRSAAEPIPGYGVTVSAAAFEDRILINTTFTAVKDSEDAPSGVRVVLSHGDTSRQEILDVLPGKEGEQRIVRGTLPIKSPEKKVLIEIFSGEHSAKLDVKIEQF
jgi:hypothetical protein